MSIVPLSIVLSILFVGPRSGSILHEFMNQTLNEDQLRAKIPEPTVTLLKPRGFTVSIPGFVRARLVGVDMTGGINLSPGAGQKYNISYPIFKSCVKIGIIQNKSWSCVVDDVDLKTGDIIECVVRATYNRGPCFQDATRYFAYTVSEDEMNKIKNVTKS